MKDEITEILKDLKFKVMINSANTDQSNEDFARAEKKINELFTGKPAIPHYFGAVDDRIVLRPGNRVVKIIIETPK